VEFLAERRVGKEEKVPKEEKVHGTCEKIKFGALINRVTY
jgi:hypothetical protein